MNRKRKTLNNFTCFTLIVLLPVLNGCKCGDQDAKSVKTEPTTEKVTVSGGLTPEQAALVVAKVGEQTITVGDITEQINKLSPYIRRRWAEPEKRREFLDNLIRVELLSQEAKRLGLGENDPEVERTVDQVMVRLMIKNDLEKDLIPSSIDEEILKQEYEKEKDKYLRPAQVRAGHIVLKTKTEADKLLADLKSREGDARYFREMALKHSIDETSKNVGGDLGYFSEEGERTAQEPKVDPAIAAAAWKIEKVGDLYSETVESPAGWHIVKLTNKRAKLERTFDSVKRMIESRLLREKRKEAMDKFVKELRDKAEIEIFEDNLANFKIPQDPMAMPQPGDRNIPSREKGTTHPKNTSGVPSHGPQTEQTN